MGFVSGFALFFMIWWLVIFTVLPLGVKRQTEIVPGLDAGAPQFHDMKRKVIITTLITTVIWCGVYFLVHSDYISFRVLAEQMELK